MIKCSPEAFAKCQEKCHHCSSADKAYFLEGSDCDKFNQELLRQPITNADRIRAMSDEELAWAIDSAIVPPGTPKLEWLRQPAEDK